VNDFKKEAAQKVADGMVRYAFVFRAIATLAFDDR
jgi:hypothetical protein